MEFCPEFLSAANSAVYTVPHDYFLVDSKPYESFTYNISSPTNMNDMEVQNSFCILGNYVPVLGNYFPSSILGTTTEFAFQVLFLFMDLVKLLGIAWTLVAAVYLIQHYYAKYKAWQAENAQIREEHALMKCVLGEVPSTKKVECCIMLDEHEASTCIACAAGHFISRPALQRYVEMELKKPVAAHQARDGCIKCPYPECESNLPEQEMAFHCKADLFAQYFEMKKEVAKKNAHDNLLELYPAVLKAEDEQRLMQESIRKQFCFKDPCSGEERFDAFKCPQCCFGPIDKLHCDDLRTHHNERVAEGVRIDNSCPVCHFYGTRIRHWGKWDGTFLAGKRLHQVQAAIEESNAPLKELKEKTKARLAELEEHCGECAEIDFQRLALNKRLRGLSTLEPLPNRPDLDEELESPAVIQRKIGEGGDMAILGPQLMRALLKQRRPKDKKTRAPLDEYIDLKEGLALEKQNVKERRTEALKKIREEYEDQIEYASDSEDEDF